MSLSKHPLRTKPARWWHASEKRYAWAVGL